MSEFKDNRSEKVKKICAENKTIGCHLRCPLSAACKPRISDTKESFDKRMNSAAELVGELVGENDGFIKSVLLKYPNVKLNDDKELANEAIKSISLSRGKCPCNKNVMCPCASVARVNDGIRYDCNCGLFVRKSDNEI